MSEVLLRTVALRRTFGGLAAVLMQRQANAQ